jgi:hypothetical protein
MHAAQNNFPMTRGAEGTLGRCNPETLGSACARHWHCLPHRVARVLRHSTDKCRAAFPTSPHRRSNGDAREPPIPNVWCSQCSRGPPQRSPVQAILDCHSVSVSRLWAAPRDRGEWPMANISFSTKPQFLALCIHGSESWKICSCATRNSISKGGFCTAAQLLQIGHQEQLRLGASFGNFAMGREARPRNII